MCELASQWRCRESQLKDNEMSRVRKHTIDIHTFANATPARNGRYIYIYLARVKYMHVRAHVRNTRWRVVCLFTLFRRLLFRRLLLPKGPGCRRRRLLLLLLPAHFFSALHLERDALVLQLIRRGHHRAEQGPRVAAQVDARIAVAHPASVAGDVVRTRTRLGCR